MSGTEQVFVVVCRMGRIERVEPGTWNSEARAIRHAAALQSCHSTYRYSVRPATAEEVKGGER